jgi:uncharacterized protein (DUF3820 family)
MQMTQGKYAGQKISEIPTSYLNWMLKGETGFFADPDNIVCDEAWLVLRERADGSMPMPWGKHEGTPVQELSNDYLAWLLVVSDTKNLNPQVFAEAQFVAEELRRHEAEFQATMSKARRRAEQAFTSAKRWQ